MVMARFVELKGPRVPILVNMDRVNYIGSNGQVTVLHMADSATVYTVESYSEILAKLNPIPVPLPASGPEVCPKCEHDEHEHFPTYDGRFKCRVCQDDEDMVDCFVETPRYQTYLEAALRSYNENLDKSDET
jgi:hypothetical protein